MSEFDQHIAEIIKRRGSAAFIAHIAKGGERLFLHLASTGKVAHGVEDIGNIA